MKRLASIALGVVALSNLGTMAPEGSGARERELIRTLHLQVLPRESGYLGLIGESAQMVAVDGRKLEVQS